MSIENAYLENAEQLVRSHLKLIELNKPVTNRDEIAVKTMLAIVKSCGGDFHFVSGNAGSEAVGKALAELSYAIADAMIEKGAEGNE